MNDLLYMEIDFRKLKLNIDAIREISNKEVIPVIKSKAYGLGDIEIAKFFQEINVEYIAVVDMIEALRLLENNIRNNILILNSLQESEYQYLNNYPNLVISINCLDDLHLIRKFNFKNHVRAHIQIDTGMNRLGFKEIEEFEKAISLVKQIDFLNLEGIYTHFTSPQNRDNQEEKFIKFTNLFPFKMIHCAASSTYPHTKLGNYVRVGLDIYGEEKPNNKQIIKVACKPLRIHKVKKGESVGYDEDYVAKKDILIAVLPIGYSNGFRRSLKGYPLMVNGKKYKTIGKICMNHIFVEVDENVTMDSEFIITSEDFPISEMAKYLNTVSHEILCMLNIDKKRYIK